MTASAGWHPDPRGRHEHRYWDGTQWTDHVADAGQISIDPVADPTPPPRALRPEPVPFEPVQEQPAASEPADRERDRPRRAPGPSEPEPAESLWSSSTGSLWAGDPAGGTPEAAVHGPVAQPEPEQAEEERQPEGADQASAPAARPAGLAVLLSLVAPGAGHLYLGLDGPRRTTAGALLAATTVAVALAYLGFASFVIGFAIWLAAVAYALNDLRAGPDSLRELRLSATLVGRILVLAGAVLAVSLVLPWYHVTFDARGIVTASGSESGFEALSLTDVVLLAVAVATIVAGLAALGRGGGSADALPPALPLLVAIGGAVALGLVCFRMFVDPVPDFGSLRGGVDVAVGRAPGILLAAAASLAICVTGASAVRVPSRSGPDEERSVTVTLS